MIFVDTLSMYTAVCLYEVVPLLLNNYTLRKSRTVANYLKTEVFSTELLLL